MATLSAVIQQEDDMYVAHCPDIGTTSQGISIEEAIANLQEATQLYLEEFPRKTNPRTILATFEVTEIAKA